MDNNSNKWISNKPKGVKVPPLKIKQLREVAEKARELLEVKEPKVDVIDLYEVRLHNLGVVYEYCEKNELTTEAGLTFPNEGLIKIREDVYRRAHEDNGFDRFTMCHEVGHLILHDNVAFSRSTHQHDWYEDSEWQADTFAAEFMMPVNYLVKLCRSPSDISKVFGVSWEAAQLRWKKLQEQRIIR